MILYINLREYEDIEIKYTYEDDPDTNGYDLEIESMKYDGKELNIELTDEEFEQILKAVFEQENSRED